MASAQEGQWVSLPFFASKGLMKRFVFKQPYNFYVKEFKPSKQCHLLYNRDKTLYCPLLGLALLTQPFLRKNKMAGGILGKPPSFED